MDVAFTRKALDDLSNIDKTIARRILDKIERLALIVDITPHIPLANTYEGLYKLRIGDWRVMYEIDHARDRIIIHRVGHRSNIYK